MIVCIGDSITYGQHLEEGEQPWPRLLTGDVLAFGVPGETTRMALERFPRDVQALSPDTVIIQFGHNDCNRWETDRGLPRVSPAAFRANLTEMVERCRAFDATPFLCTLTPTERSATHMADCATYDELIRVVAYETGARIIDVRLVFWAIDGLLMEDGLHLTAKGHELYAKTVQQVLEADGVL